VRCRQLVIVFALFSRTAFGVPIFGRGMFQGGMTDAAFRFSASGRDGPYSASIYYQGITGPLTWFPGTTSIRGSTLGFSPFDYGDGIAGANGVPSNLFSFVLENGSLQMTIYNDCLFYCPPAAYGGGMAHLLVTSYSEVFDYSTNRRRSYSGTFVIYSVPEPSTAMLVVCGLTLTIAFKKARAVRRL
jgi:hypothetical protein